MINGYECGAGLLACGAGLWPCLTGGVTQRRRAFIRFFACEEDLSHEPLDASLPDAVATGEEPFLVVGAMAGG